MSKAQLDWLERNKEKINVMEAAKQIGMPETTLRLYLKGDKKLPKKYKDVLVEWVREFRK